MKHTQTQTKSVVLRLAQLPSAAAKYWPITCQTIPHVAWLRCQERSLAVTPSSHLYFTNLHLQGVFQP